MNSHTTLLVGTAVGVLSLATPGRITAQEVMRAAVQSPMAGAWVLNRDESDNPQEKMEAAMRSARRQAQQEGPNRGDRSARGRGRRGGGGAGGGGARLSPEAQASNRTAQQRTMRGGMMMSIVITDSTAAIGYDERIPWVFPTNEKKRDFEEGVEITGKWDGDKLQVETNTEGGLRVRETYELKDDDKVLEVSVVMENSRSNLRVRFKRVYNAEDAEQG